MATSIVCAAFAAAILIGTPLANGAEVPPPAYQLIALPAGVPSEVLYSVALQESGTRLRGQLVPWPWTLNVAGAGYRFATRSDACKALMIADEPGKRYFFDYLIQYYRIRRRAVISNRSL